MSEYTFNYHEQALMSVLERIKDCDVFEDERCHALLVELIQRIRPKTYWQYGYAQHQIEFLTNIIKTNPAIRTKIRILFSQVFIRSDLSEVLIESGIQSAHSFFYEFKNRVRHKILPPLKHKGSFLYAINTIFYKKRDYLWIERVDDDVWYKLFYALGVELDISNHTLMSQLLVSVNVLSTRIAALGVDYEITRFTSKDKAKHFIEQNRIAHILVYDIPDTNTDKSQQQQLTADLLKELQICENVLAEIHANIPEQGTSLSQTYILLRIKQLIERLRLVLDIADHDGILDILRLVDLFKTVITNENTKNSLRHHLKNNVQFLAYRIAEHERNTGEHYITDTPAEYRNMLLSALWGGFIIAFIAIIKNLFHFFRMAPFWQGLAYSINYASGFILIYASGATLATKQPAMTASTIASALDDKKVDSPNLPELAILISKVWRSQTASFVGNIAMAFPMSLLLAYCWQWCFGFDIASGEHAQSLLDAQNMLKTPVYVYATITGVFLYISGIISGYFDNLSIYGKIPERLRDHPTLRRSFALPSIDKLATYVGKNLGGIMGNICLGLMLGMAGSIGYMFGIDFDIRHITISTGNFAIGLQGLGFEVGLSEVLWVSASILLIGFINFSVSFGLAFFTALASRKIKFREYRRFSLYMRRLIVKYPFDFVYPPKTPRKPSDFMQNRPN